MTTPVTIDKLGNVTISGLFYGDLQDILNAAILHRYDNVPKPEDASFKQAKKWHDDLMNTLRGIDAGLQAAIKKTHEGPSGETTNPYFKTFYDEASARAEATRLLAKADGRDFRASKYDHDRGIWGIETYAKHEDRPELGWFFAGFLSKTDSILKD